MRQRLLARAAVVGVLLTLSGRSAFADPTVSTLAHQAMAECDEGRLAADRAERAAHFARGEELAQRAVHLDDASADAHFAVFCNRGESMRLDGESIRDVFALRGLLAELDRTLALQPDHPAALAAKGTFLIRLPRLLGGNVDRGEAILRRVLVLDPETVTARLGLARVYEYRGQFEESLAYATRALEIARELGRADKIAEAQSVLADLASRR